MSIYVFATLKVQSPFLRVVMTHLHQLAEQTRQESGCLQYQLFSAMSDSCTIHILEQYQDPEAVEVHRHAEHYLAYRSFVKDKLAAPILVQVMQQLDI